MIQVPCLEYYPCLGAISGLGREILLVFPPRVAELGQVRIIEKNEYIYIYL